MITCMCCSTENPDKAKFCMECGKQLPAAAEKTESWEESAGGP